MLGLKDLHDNQLEGVQRIHENQRCALWMPMGGGKTVTTLTALDALATTEQVYPALIMAPLRVTKTVWPEEPAKWEHLAHLRVAVMAGEMVKRFAALDSDSDIYCVNYENLKWLKNALNGEWPFVTLVADEVTRLSGFRLKQGSARAGFLRDVAHTKIHRFVGLTGTPAPNGLSKLWGQTWFIDEGKRLGKSYTAFEQRWFSKGWDGYSLSPLPNAQGEIQQALSDVCFTIEGLQVDEPVVTPVWADLSHYPRETYKRFEREMFAEIEGKGVEVFNAAALTSVLHQVTNGATYTDDQKNWELVHDEKLAALDSVIEEASGAPVLVAYHFKHDLARLRKAYPQGRLLDTDPKTIRDWNEGRIPLLFAHPASCGHGINLAPGGNILAFFSLDWNLENHMQIIERIGPMRQKQAGLDRPVHLYYIMVRNTLDEDIYERLKSKREIQEILLDAMKRYKARRKRK